MFLEDLKQSADMHGIEYIHILPFAQGEYNSVVVALLPYYAGDFPSPLSRYARGMDYHKTGKELLEQILMPLSAKYGFSYHVYIDASPLEERRLALEAGLGVLGKNQLVLNEKYGSYCFIATALTTWKTETVPCQVQECSGCGACIRTCPGHALTENGYQREKCLSYLNQEKHLTAEQEEFVAEQGMCWGCDICQTACPCNQDVPVSPIPDFTRELLLQIKIPEGMTNRAFREKYGKYAFAYKGKNILIRNLKLIQK